MLAFVTLSQVAASLKLYRAKKGNDSVVRRYLHMFRQHQNGVLKSFDVFVSAGTLRMIPIPLQMFSTTFLLSCFDYVSTLTFDQEKHPHHPT